MKAQLFFIIASMLIAASCSKSTDTYNPPLEKKVEKTTPPPVKNQKNGEDEVYKEPDLQYQNKTVNKDIAIPFEISEGSVEVIKQTEGFSVKFTGFISEIKIKTRRFRLAASIRAFSENRKIFESMILPEIESTEKDRNPLNIEFFKNALLDKSPEKAEIIFSYRDQMNEEQSDNLIVANWDGTKVSVTKRTQKTSWATADKKKKVELAAFENNVKTINSKSRVFSTYIKIKTPPAQHQAVELSCGDKKYFLTPKMSGSEPGDSILMRFRCSKNAKKVVLKARDMLNGEWILDSQCGDKYYRFSPCKK